MAKHLPNANEMQQQYNEDRYDDLSESFLIYLQFLGASSFKKLSSPESGMINSFVHTFLTLFITDNYTISPQYAERFIKYNPVISNIVALSDYINTDTQLASLQLQHDAFLKILVLLSPRNNVKFNYNDFFARHAPLASLWYECYYTDGLVSKIQFDNMNQHQGNFDPRWQISKSSKCPRLYFGSTYVNPGTDRFIKQHINKLIKPLFSKTVLINKPFKNKIAIVSARWGQGTAVYKTCAGFVEALRQDYDLTLIQLKNKHTNFDATIFSDIRHISMEEILSGELSAINPNEFILAYFTDIGMQNEDIYLSNLRFAPIQIAGYGHPVSTWGGEIDYWIGGLETEYIDNYEQRYSERLVLIPGIGAINNLPSYITSGIKRTSERVIINCPWSAQKCNYHHLMLLNSVLSQTKSKPIFRIFQGTLSRNNSFLPFERDVQDLLGKENVGVIPPLPYDEYMKLLEEGDFSIDSWPFGGCNTIIDSLWLGKPVVTLEGNHFFNRASSAILRQIGLDELITHSSLEYISCIARLIDDNQWRDAIKLKLTSIDLNSKLFDPTYGSYFKKAVDHLITNHDVLKNDISRFPIMID